LGSEYEAVLYNKTLLNWTMCNAPQVIQFIETTVLDMEIIWSSKPKIEIYYWNYLIWTLCSCFQSCFM